MGVTTVPAGRGATWIRTAVGLVMEQPVFWIGGFAAILGLTIVLNFLPFVGWVFNQIVNLVATVFFLKYAHAQRQGQEFDPDQTLKHLMQRLPRLLLMLLVNSAFFILCAFPMIGALVAAGGMEFLLQQKTAVPDLSPLSMISIALGGLISGIAACFVMAATIFTTPLILFQNQPIATALRMSLKAVGRNIAPLFLYAILVILMLLVCVIPLGLGLLLGLPTIAASFYLIYEELLGKPEAL